MGKMTSTHTFAELELSAAAYDEIAAKLKDAGYDHAFIDGALDMRGIGVTRGSEDSETTRFYHADGSFDSFPADAVRRKRIEAAKELDELRAKKFANFAGDECWLFQGDGHDHLESLTCPVVIGADRLLAIIKQKDNAYEERNRVVALAAQLAIAMGWPVGIARTAIEGWSDDWHGCIYIDTPHGQVSWHYHDSQAHLFQHLPAYSGKWDGHDTETKYRRVRMTSVCDFLPASGIERTLEYMGRVFHEIHEHMKEGGGEWGIEKLVPASEAVGQRDEYDGFFDHVIVDQRANGVIEDSYYGTVYFPVGDRHHYIAVSFSM